MKNFRKICAVAVLTLMIAFPTFAGEILAPGVVEPQPTPQCSATGDIGMPGASVTGEILGPGMAALDPVTEAALDLLQSLLSLF